MKHPDTKYIRWHLKWLSSLSLVLAVLIFSALSAQAQPAPKLDPIGGPGGGYFVAYCPGGHLLTGFQLWTGDDVDAILPLCVTAYGPADVYLSCGVAPATQPGKPQTVAYLERDFKLIEDLFATPWG